ncbi:Hint domain-containing protein [Sulfitobacter sp. S190]|uniref:Hint domain-containing protein n=1 Tax=Sulfitobacter sp. S190 TaxID=2867022 RepID=UPI0021A493E0|nr:Hint domain-containing protein [Sulfitobacter sp. S190]UWR22399.1 Hint domain-containing protein [Sulfitobacter sp. S190]
MTWLALADHTDRRFSLRGLGHGKSDAPLLEDRPDTLLTRGSIVFETQIPADVRPQVLFGYKTPHPSRRSLVFQAIPGGGVSMVQVQDSSYTHAAINHDNAGRSEVLRVMYAWDTTYNWGRLTLEQAGDSAITSVAVDNPQPLKLDDLRDLMLGRGQQDFAQDVIFAALSNDIEPVGPSPSLAPDTPIATPWGYRAASTLKRGDTVYTHEGDVVPVLHNVLREVPARGSYAPIRMRAPYFGLQEDIVIGPDQHVVIDGPEVEYLFACEKVLTPARHLVNGFAARPETTGPTARYCQLILPQHETLLAAGAPLESMYIGRMRRDQQQVVSSVLAYFDRALLPEHAQPAHKVLKWYEAIHLAKRRAA